MDDTVHAWLFADSAAKQNGSEGLRRGSQGRWIDHARNSLKFMAIAQTARKMAELYSKATFVRYDYAITSPCHDFEVSPQTMS